MAFTYELLINIGVFTLASVGLMLIFGLMGIINMSHGEFIMLGAYITSYILNTYGVPFLVGVLLAFVGTALFGILVERLIVRWLYGDIIMGLVATWGLSLLLSGGALFLWGPTLKPVDIPVSGHVTTGLQTYGTYSLVLFAVAVVVILLLYLILQKSAWGVDLRATIQNPATAEALGVPTKFIYMTGFGLGAGLGGLAGALLAPLVAITPTMGASYLPIAFIIVIVAGTAHIVSSLVVSVLVLTLAFTAGFYYTNALIGLVAMLVTAIILIRLTPDGIANQLERMIARFELARSGASRLDRGADS